MTLDRKLIQSSTPDDIVEQFNLYKTLKTDDIDGKTKVKIEMGVDGVYWETFEKNIQNVANDMSVRIANGTYFFHPFREVIKAKDFGVSVEEAIKNDRFRVLSIASVGDVIFQKIVYDVVSNFSETIFNQIKNVSFGYRKGYSASAAARQVYRHVQDGFVHVLDADIKGFFDNISHELLYNKLKEYFGEGNPLILKYLKRFYSADKVEWKSYNGNVKKFYRKKPVRIHRTVGIPQGGVLSGLVANFFLHDFDKWVVGILGEELNTEIRYVRYADDFVILLKDVSKVMEIKERVRAQLEAIKLTLHPDSKKTKILDLSVKGVAVEFVGFSISETGIRVKKSNVERFKSRALELIRDAKIYTNHRKSLHFFIKRRLMFKLIGNAAKFRRCEVCKKLEQRRSWLDFFLTITDVQQLRAIDRWMRQQLYKLIYEKAGTRLKKRDLEDLGLESLEKLYYKYRKKKNEDFCVCGVMTAQLIEDTELSRLIELNS